MSSIHQLELLLVEVAWHSQGQAHCHRQPLFPVGTTHQFHSQDCYEHLETHRRLMSAGWLHLGLLAPPQVQSQLVYLQMQSMHMS